MSIHRQLPSRHPALPFVMCHDGTGLRYERAEARFLGVMTENGPTQRAHERRSGRPGPKLSWKIDQFVPASPSAPGAWRRAKDTSLRLEKRLRPVVPLGRNRVGPLPRNRVVPFRRNQEGPITRNPAINRFRKQSSGKISTPLKLMCSNPTGVMCRSVAQVSEISELNCYNRYFWQKKYAHPR
jgi:hypothetical protein